MINLSRKIDPLTLGVLREVSAICSDLNLPWIVVGATARDLVLHYGYGAQIRSATQDIDFAIRVADWATFDTIKDKLLDRGFRETRTTHRLIGPNQELIDLVPFGKVENADSVVEWPPKGDVAMNVLGFSEACENADNVLLDEEDRFDVPVATPAGMMLLKLIAWTDREPDKRQKDAADIKYIIENYERIPDVVDEAYDVESAPVIEGYEWDLTLTCSHLLGRYSSQTASPQTNKAIRNIFASKIERLPLERLVADISSNQLEEERNKQILDAFHAGFVDT